MIAGDNGAYLGLLSFLSFGLSVIAAVLAIDMYTLLRTGEFGKSWRVMIIASVMFALVQALRMAEHLEWKFADYGLSQIAELMFVMALAYAFFLQRRTFTRAATLRGEQDNANNVAEDSAALTRNEADANDRTRLRATHTKDVLEEAGANSRAGEDDASVVARPLGDRRLEQDPDIEWGTPSARESKLSAASSASALK
jgi:hypothetical protein